MVIGNYLTDKINNNAESFPLICLLAKYAIESVRRHLVFLPFPMSFCQGLDKKKDFTRAEKVVKDIYEHHQRILQFVQVQSETLIVKRKEKKIGRSNVSDTYNVDKSDVKSVSNEEHRDQALVAEIGEDQYIFLKFIMMSNICQLYLIYRTATCDIYSIINSEQKEKEFATSVKDNTIYFHGSSNENWFSIIRNGLKCLSDTCMMTHGKSGGKGIYLAPKASKSLSFCENIIAGVLIDRKYALSATPELVIADDRMVLLRYLFVFPEEIDKSTGFNHINHNIRAAEIDKFIKTIEK
jgi:hypothetical protein